MLGGRPQDGRRPTSLPSGVSVKSPFEGYERADPYRKFSETYTAAKPGARSKATADKLG